MGSNLPKALKLYNVIDTNLGTLEQGSQKEFRRKHMEPTCVSSPTVRAREGEVRLTGGYEADMIR